MRHLHQPQGRLQAALGRHLSLPFTTGSQELAVTKDSHKTVLLKTLSTRKSSRHPTLGCRRGILALLAAGMKDKPFPCLCSIPHLFKHPHALRLTSLQKPNEYLPPESRPLVSSGGAGRCCVARPECGTAGVRHCPFSAQKWLCCSVSSLSPAVAPLSAGGERVPPGSRGCSALWRSPAVSAPPAARRPRFPSCLSHPHFCYHSGRAS